MINNSSKNESNIEFIVADEKDIDTLEDIRESAFQPIFDSFRNILGKTIYEYAQLPEDEAQKELLKSLFDEDSIWKTWKVNLEEVTVGFVSIRIDKKAKVGEIGLNAVHPKYAKRGIGTQMYDFAVEIMRNEGMKVATVATGGDPSHLSARKAYRKAGFDVEIPSVWMCQVIE
ncbi:MAG: GNAT family N-acetyltransferase [Bacteroidetes bacterium]|nr:MAG: GNAT family N-acetyltransferase [Bacteroidota bacterium]